MTSGFADSRSAPDASTRTSSGRCGAMQPAAKTSTRADTRARNVDARRGAMRYHRVRSSALFRALVRTPLLYWCVLSLTFALLRLAPGDPATFLLPPGATASDAVRLRAELGLDRPIAVQYARWLGVDAAGRPGHELRRSKTRDGGAADALPISLALGGLTLLLSFLVGIIVGLVQAARRGSITDHLLTGVSVVLAASPAYWLGLGAIACFTYLASSLSMPMWMRLPAVGMTTPGAELSGLAHRGGSRAALDPARDAARRDRRRGRRAVRTHERARCHRRGLGAHRAREGTAPSAPCSGGTCSPTCALHSSRCLRSRCQAPSPARCSSRRSSVGREWAD